MMCPRCGNEWDVSKNPCSRCGLLVRLPNRSGTRSTTSSLQGNTQTFHSGGMPPIRQQPGSISPIERSLDEPVSSPSLHMPILPITPIPFSETEHKVRGNVQEFLQPLPQQEQDDSSLPSYGSSTFSAPRSANSSSLNYESNPFLTKLQKSEPGTRQSFIQNDEAFGKENASQRGVPQRPQTQLPLQHPTQNLLRDAQRPIRPSRLVTDSLFKEELPSAFLTLPSSAEFLRSSTGGSSLDLPLLSPGALLRSGRYRLSEPQDHQDWLDGVFETMWIAQDAQRSGAQVMICELVTPDSKSMMMQSTLRTATMALTSIGRHPHIPTLWDAFSDQGRNFFVFEPTEGESLMTRMRRTGRPLSEQEIIKCCLQMTEILEILSQQSPPFVHGLIRPEHIVMRHADGSHYSLTNFSIILAGGATKFVAGIDRSRVSPYTSNEFIRGEIDVRSDLYSLIATAYHAATRSIPASAGGNIQRAQLLNPTLSSEFDAILTRGLRPIASQRYQHPSELRQDLLSIPSVSRTLSSTNDAISRLVSQQTERASLTQGPLSQNLLSKSQASTSESVSQILPGLLAPTVVDVSKQARQPLLPRPEELPPMPARNNPQQAAFWLIGILICLIVIVILSRGLL